MPIYEYECDKCGHAFEREQAMADPPIKTCPKCKGRKVTKLISRSSFVLKGGGWYADGYADAKKKASADSGSTSSPDSAAASDSSSSSTESKTTTATTTADAATPAPSTKAETKAAKSKKTTGKSAA